MHRSSAHDPKRRTSRMSGSNRASTSRLPDALFARIAEPGAHQRHRQIVDGRVQRNGVGRTGAPHDARRARPRPRTPRPSARSRPPPPPTRRRSARPPTPRTPRCRRRSSPCRRSGRAPTAADPRSTRTAPPPSSPSTGSPGRSSASRSRSSRSVSVSTMVTGSVGVLLVRTADPASARSCAVAEHLGAAPPHELGGLGGQPFRDRPQARRDRVHVVTLVSQHRWPTGYRGSLTQLAKH